MKVLIVEDEPKVRRALKRMLADIEPDISEMAEADNGEEGLRLILEDKPDLLLLDMIMPGMSGDELFDRIRALQLDIPVIVVSGYHDFTLVRQALANDAIDYILKPFDKEDVGKALQKAKERLETAKFRDRTERLVMEMRSEQSRQQLQSVLRNVAIGRLGKRELELLPGYMREETCELHVLAIRNYETALHERFGKDIELLDYAIRKCIAEFADLHGHEMQAGPPGQYEWCRWIAVRPNEERPFRPALLTEVLGRVLKLSGFIVSAAERQPIEGYAEAIAELESSVLYANLDDAGGETNIARSTESMEAIDRFVAHADHLVRHQLAFRIREDVEELFRLAADAGQLTAMYLFQAWMNMNAKLEASFGSPSIRRAKALDSAETFAKHICFRTDLAKQLFAASLEEYVAAYGSRAAGARRDNRTLAVKEYIDIGYRDPLSLADLAGRFFVSKEYLASRFKREFGLTVTQYIHEVRLAEAKRLLTESGLNVSAIAASVGYDHFSYFDKRFKEKYGVTPTEYRNMSKQGESP